MSDAPELVFVGGTGRSGTTVTAELLGRHSHFADVPIECRFHCNPNGLADVVSGRATPEQFVRKLRTYWWHRVRTGSRVIVPAGVAGRARLGANPWAAPGLGHEESRVRGLHQIIDRDRFDAAVASSSGPTATTSSRPRAASSTTCSSRFGRAPESRRWWR